MTTNHGAESFLEVAKLALARYDLKVKDVSFLVEATNMLYRVEDHSGNQFVLKIFEEESSTIEDNLAEVFLMNHIAEKNLVLLPSVLPAMDGSFVQVVESKATEQPKRLALYTWLVGEDLDGNENRERFIQLGELIAKLHEATYGLRIPEHLSPKKWDKVFYYNGESAIYKNAEYEPILSSEYHEVMDAIIPLLNEGLASYYQKNAEQLQLIHADLNPWNVRVSGDRLSVLDFEEALLGLPIHDIAIALYYYAYEDDFDFEEVKGLFLQGYEQVRPLPPFTDFDLDLFMTARRVSFLNYILTVSEDPGEYIKMSIPRVKDFIKKYDLKLL